MTPVQPGQPLVEGMPARKVSRGWHGWHDIGRRVRLRVPGTTKVKYSTGCASSYPNFSPLSGGSAYWLRIDRAWGRRRLHPLPLGVRTDSVSSFSLAYYYYRVGLASGARCYYYSPGRTQQAVTPTLLWASMFVYGAVFAVYCTNTMSADVIYSRPGPDSELEILLEQARRPAARSCPHLDPALLILPASLHDGDDML
ncbi:hypothetical protein BDW71DRAFT_132213 [Aspergillus fruticulosus]